MTRIEFGAVAALPNLATSRELYRYLDRAGFSQLWISDSQSLMHEMTVSMTVAALETDRIIINGGVSNPLTRHPAMLASSLASIDDLSGGRAALSISTGDSAVFNLGLRPAKLDTLEAFIGTMQRLWTDHETEHEGRTVRLLWPRRRVPIYMAAEGPRSLRLAGRIADGVIIGMGLTPEVIEGALGYLGEGLRESGRSLDDIDVWWLAKWNIAETKRAAIDEIRMGLAASVNHAFRFHLDGKFVPEEYHDAIAAIQQQYVFEEHEKHGEGLRNAQLTDEFGMTDYLAERFAITGTVGDFIERCEQLAELGVRRIRLSVAGHDHADLLRLIGDRVLPHFAE
jgi:5,10-methylenetetrahydromethanopterin reductase